MVNLPNFSLRRQRLTPIEFVPAFQVFKPMVEVRFLKDVSGWVGGTKKLRKKWSFATGEIAAIDSDKAREFVAKGYATPTHPLDPPLTRTEIEDFQGQVTTVGL
jgi:hypothetical protein